MKDDEKKNKKLKRRNQVKNPALVYRFNHRLRQPQIDFDYLDQLNEEELAWLNRFMEEFNNASLNLDDAGHVIPDQNLHQTDDHKKSIYDSNNARNRDLYGLLKYKGEKFEGGRLINYDDAIIEVENYLSRDVDPDAMENSYVEFLEGKQIAEMLAEYDKAMSDFNEEL